MINVIHQGLLLASIALALFIALVTFIVVKITFTFDLELLIVKKSGVLRYFHHDQSIVELLNSIHVQVENASIQYSAVVSALF